MLHEFIPRAACAIVKSKFYFNNIALQEIMSHTDSNILVQKMFNTKEEALQWLKEVDLSSFETQSDGSNNDENK
jgi:hypothetical protein